MENCEILKSELARVTAERDAAVNDLRNLLDTLTEAFSGCYRCKNISCKEDEEPCNSCRQGNSKWEHFGAGGK